MKITQSIDYFGDFISSVVISEDRLQYLKDAGIEIVNCEPYDAQPQLNDTRAFYISFKVNNMTFLHFYQAGIKYAMEKYYKP